MSHARDQYVRLAQFARATKISKANPNSRALLKHAIDKIEDIDYAIPENTPVQRHRPEYVGFTALHFAVLMKNESCVRLLLERGADPSLENEDGFTPVRLAAESSYTKERRCLNLQGKLRHPILHMLLTAQVKTDNTFNISCNYGVSHFHLACMLDHEEAIKLFLEDSTLCAINGTVNSDSPILPGYTPMHFAVRYGSVNAARMLLEYGADLTKGDIFGTTPLQMLVERNLELVDVISTMEEKKSDDFQMNLKANEEILDLMLNWMRLNKIDPVIPVLHASCAKRTTDEEVVLRLDEHDVNAALETGSTFGSGYTPLHIAAHFNVETVLLLLKHGANLSAKDAKGITPFDICVSHLKAEDVQKIIEFESSLRDISFTNGRKLLDVLPMIRDPKLINGNYFHYQVTSDSPLWAGYTILHLAVEFARRLDRSDNIFDKSDEYESNRLTPRGVVDEVSKEVVQECLKFANVLTQSANGMTALHLAFRQHKRDLVNLLLGKINENGMECNPSDFDKLSHLHIMCAEGRTSIVQAYLTKHVGEISLNHKVKTGFHWYKEFTEPAYARPGSTALHLAVIFKKTDIVRLLLEHGADILVQDDDGLTPLQLAFLTNGLRTPMRNVLISGLKTRNSNPTTSEGFSLFHVACYTNNLSLAEDLLSNEVADIEAAIRCQPRGARKERPTTIKANQYYTSQYDCSDIYLQLAPYSGYRALHMAIIGQALEMVYMLLSKGANRHARTEAGLSPLQLALQFSYQDQRSVEIVICLTSNSAAYGDWTALHVACLMKVPIAVERALVICDNVDAKLAPDSPLWPGSTALHLLLEEYPDWSNGTMSIMLEKILRRGADITLPNAYNLTPLHLAYYRNLPSAVLSMLRSAFVLKSNPVDNEGLSHFHIACAFSDCSLISMFLERHLADVNIPKDYFALGDDAGYSPLHFSNVEINAMIYEILLRSGADPMAVDCNGSTFLHKVARDMVSSGRPIHEVEVSRIFCGNVNINTKDIFGTTPLEFCFQNRATYLISLLLNYGARINCVNPISNRGLLSYADDSNLQFILEKAKDIASIDPDTGFNAIHNIISSDTIFMNHFSLGRAIEKLIEKGCDLDKPDAEGRTPLHIAVKLKESSKVVKILLDLGADVNVIDNAGNTPLVYCECYNKTREILLSHLKKLSRFDLFINDVNKNRCDELSQQCEKFETMLMRHRGFVDHEFSNNWHDELKLMSEDIIFRGFSLADLLKHKGVASYPRLSKEKRMAIANSLSFDRMVGKCPNLVCLLRLQHRRGIARSALLEPANAAMQFCARQLLPDSKTLSVYCAEMIIEFLTNEEMQSLIETVG